MGWLRRMSNDLLFSVLPREGTVKVFTDSRVQRVQKALTQETIGEDERDAHAGVRHESGEAQYFHHRVNPISDEHPQQKQQTQSDEKAKQGDENAHTDDNDKETSSPSSSIYHHLDIYI